VSFQNNLPAIDFRCCVSTRHVTHGFPGELRIALDFGARQFSCMCLVWKRGGEFVRNGELLLYGVPLCQLGRSMALRTKVRDDCVCIRDWMLHCTSCPRSTWASGRQCEIEPKRTLGGSHRLLHIGTPSLDMDTALSLPTASHSCTHRSGSSLPDPTWAENCHVATAGWSLGSEP
jgi:hypothetical protein